MSLSHRHQVYLGVFWAVWKGLCHQRRQYNNHRWLKTNIKNKQTSKLNSDKSLWTRFYKNYFLWDENYDLYDSLLPVETPASRNSTLSQFYKYCFYIIVKNSLKKTAARAACGRISLAWIWLWPLFDLCNDPGCVTWPSASDSLMSLNLAPSTWVSHGSAVLCQNPNVSIRDAEATSSPEVLLIGPLTRGSQRWVQVRLRLGLLGSDSTGIQPSAQL